MQFGLQTQVACLRNQVQPVDCERGMDEKGEHYQRFPKPFSSENNSEFIRFVNLWTECGPPGTDSGKGSSKSDSCREIIFY